MSPQRRSLSPYLRGLKYGCRYEEHHKVEITDNALEAAVKLSSRYINDRFLPDKDDDLIDGAASRVRLQNYTRSRIRLRDIRG